MTSRRESLGHTIVAAGAALLVASLWLPWYSFQIPQGAIDSAEQLAQQSGALGPLVNAGAQIAASLGTLHVDSWRVLSTLPWLLLVLAVVGGGLSVLVLADRLSNVAKPTGIAGLIGVALVGYRIGVVPIQDLLHPAWGIYAALIGAGAMLGGSIIAEQRPGAKQELSLAEFVLNSDPPGATGWSTARSAPPPS